MTTMTDLLLSRGSTKYKEQVQKLLESQPAVKKDRARELALGNSFLGLPGRGVVSRPGGGGSGPRSRADLETPKTQLYQHASHFFCIFLHVFCISQTRSHFFCICFCISQTESHVFDIFFAFPKPAVIFCIFLHFLDRVCHLHRLPDSYEKTTRK